MLCFVALSAVLYFFALWTKLCFCALPTVLCYSGLSQSYTSLNNQQAFLLRIFTSAMLLTFKTVLYFLHLKRCYTSYIFTSAILLTFLPVLYFFYLSTVLLCLVNCAMLYRAINKLAIYQKVLNSAKVGGRVAASGLRFLSESGDVSFRKHRVVRESGVRENPVAVLEPFVEKSNFWNEKIR